MKLRAPVFFIAPILALTACASGDASTPTAEVEVGVDTGGGDSSAVDSGTTMTDTGTPMADAGDAEAAPPAPTCTDLIKNGAESDVDCGGGTCPKCALTRACALAADCASGICTGGRCVAPSCTDTAKNGTETDVDCGGGSCPSCADGKTCGGAADCASGICTATKCAAPSCIDTVKNGGETDVDCGGTCPKCIEGKGCSAAADCASGFCSSGKCVAPSCSDGAKNGTETDVDCGGSCGKCAIGKGCSAPADCASGTCTSGVCAASCTDTIKNGTETDVDCGGSCAGCAVGKGCGADTDCAGSLCIGGKCGYAATCKELHTKTPTLTTGKYTIDPDGTGPIAPFEAYCDMTTEGGGWTLVLKANGGSSAFTYDSLFWLDGNVLNETSTNADYTDAKLKAYLSVPFTAMMLSLAEGGATRSLVMPLGGSSMVGRMTSTYAATSLGREKWKSLLSSGSLQPNCNREGINALGNPPNDTGPWTRVRIGIISNQEGDCDTPDSFIGVGGYSNVCGADPAISAGNVATCSPDSGDRATPAFAFVWVR